MDIDTDNAFPRTKIGRDHQMRDAFRHGKVIERKLDEKQGPLVRVQYLDKQGLISAWLPVKQFGSRLTSHCYVPKIGDDVNVNMLPNGSEDGFVDGSFFNTGNPPPEGVDIDTRHFKSEDGTVIEYREIDSTFNLVNPAGPVRVEAVDVFVHATGGIVEIIAATAVIITAPEIILTGHMIFNGLITHTGDMTTTGVHTDANGIHGSMLREQQTEIERLRQRVLILEERIDAIEKANR